MRQLIIILIFSATFHSCSFTNSKSDNDKETVENVTADLTAKETKSEQITVQDFFDLGVQNKVSNDYDFKRFDTVITNVFDSTNIDTLSTLTFKDNEVKMYNNFVTNALIVEPDFQVNDLIHISMNRQDFIDTFSDFKTRMTDELIDGPIVEISDNSISFHLSFERTTTWTFGFKNDVLSYLYYEVYFE